MDFGVFIPIANNGWIISENSPQYMPTFDLNKRVVQEAERQGFAFALSMVKLRGFGGKTEFWDHALESFTLMAGLAACTERIKLYASTAVLTLPPAMVARMATTIDQIAPGRFGINIVSGWASGEYTQIKSGLITGNDLWFQVGVIEGRWIGEVVSVNAAIVFGGLIRTGVVTHLSPG